MTAILCKDIKNKDLSLSPTTVFGQGPRYGPNRATGNLDTHEGQL